jgi:membrane protease YdiL (CAAX protease family)
MTLAVAVVGVAAQVVAWSIVASGRGSVWTTVGAANAAAGAAAVVVSPPPLSGRLAVAPAFAVGVAAGLALYVATGIFVRAIGRWWPAFIRHANAIYRQGGSRLPLAAGAAAVVAVGEELFWRGFVQRELTARLDSFAVGAVLTLAAYVVTNTASRNLSIVVGALVGGALWGGLAWWSAGVLASVVAHAAWTALMVTRPVVGEAA